MGNASPIKSCMGYTNKLKSEWQGHVCDRLSD